jgi:hypothetical protein
MPALSSEKVFLSLQQTCYVAGGQVWISKNTERFYSEVFGAFNSVNAQICGKSFFDTRTCRTVTLYNFRLACKGGVATAPQLFMALFGSDKETQQNGFSLSSSGNQLFYLDPVRDFSGNQVRRMALPPGYAPLHTLPIDTFLRRLVWDDARGRPSLSRTPTFEQEKRIQSLFALDDGYLAPFPEANLRRAISISEELPTRPQKLEDVNRDKVGGVHFDANSTPAVIAGTVFAGLLAWIVGMIVKAAAGGERNFGRHIIGESVAMIVSGLVLYQFGIVDEIKLLSVPIGAGISVAVISAVKFS